MFALLKELFTINQTFNQLGEELDKEMAELPQQILQESVVVVKDVVGETAGNIMQFLISM